LPRYLVMSVLICLMLSSPNVRAEDREDALCHSEELFIFYSAKNSGLNLSKKEYRSYVQRESRKIAKRYKSIQQFPSFSEGYADINELLEICDRLDAVQFRKLVLFLAFFEMGTDETPPPEQ